MTIKAVMTCVLYYDIYHDTATTLQYIRTWYIMKNKVSCNTASEIPLIIYYIIKWLQWFFMWNSLPLKVGCKDTTPDRPSTSEGIVEDVDKFNHLNAKHQNPVHISWYLLYKQYCHYNDVIMAAIASQITSLTIVFSTVYLDTDQRKHQSSM